MKKNKKRKHLYHVSAFVSDEYRPFYVSSFSGCHAVHMVIRHLHEVEKISLDDISLKYDGVSCELPNFLY